MADRDRNDLGVQYRDARFLAKRANLHAKYSNRDWWGFLKSIPPWRAGDRILDLGCGPGWFWAGSSVSLPPLQITLLDISIGMIHAARDVVAKRQARSTWHGLVGDAMALPFADNSFDGVVCCHVLYHAADPDHAMAEIARVIRPGGWALLAGNYQANFAQIEDLIEQIWNVRPSENLARRFGMDDVADRMAPHAAEISVHDFDDTLTVTDPDDVVAYALSFPPGLGAPEAECADLARAVADMAAASDTQIAITKRQGAAFCQMPLTQRDIA